MDPLAVERLSNCGEAGCCYRAASPGRAPIAPRRTAGIGSSTDGANGYGRQGMWDELRPELDAGGNPAGVESNTSSAPMAVPALCLARWRCTAQAAARHVAAPSVLFAAALVVHRSGLIPHLLRGNSGADDPPDRQGCLTLRSPNLD